MTTFASHADPLPVELEPTADELQAAWTAAINAEGIPGAQAQAFQDLLAMRNRKWTWYGERENNLRFALDRYISMTVPCAR